MVRYQSTDVSYLVDLISRLDDEPASLDDSGLLQEVAATHKRLLALHLRSVMTLSACGECFMTYYRYPQAPEIGQVYRAAERHARTCEKIVRSLGVGSFRVSV